MTIDLNCDMGEGLSNDALLMPYISSANIACGYHAGNESIMQTTIGLAIQHNVAIGAHPGFRDRENFGRTEMHLPPDEVYDLVAEQTNRLIDLTKKAGGQVHHVKPHGALYNMSARDEALATVIAQAVYDTDPSLLLFGLSGSHSLSAAKKIGLATAGEVFADRTYQDDGTLTPRNKPNAMITDETVSLQQVLQMVHQKNVITVTGKRVAVDADTICLHGDGAHAVAFAKRIYQSLQNHSIEIRRC